MYGCQFGEFVVGCFMVVQLYFHSGEHHHTNIKEGLKTRNLHVHHKPI